VLYGGILIRWASSAWAFSLAVLLSGLLLLVLAPAVEANVSTMVGSLRAEDQRRDAGFSLFYMGITWRVLRPLACGYVARE